MWLKKAGGTMPLYDLDLDKMSNNQIISDGLIIAAATVGDFGDEIWMHCIIIVKKGSVCTIIDPAAFRQNNVVVGWYNIQSFVLILL